MRNNKTKKQKLELIGVEAKTKKHLDAQKQHKRETYDDVICRLLDLRRQKKNGR